MGAEPLWVTLGDVIELHDEQIKEHGGTPGVKDHGLVESAVMRPRQRFHYEGAPLNETAASLAYGLARNHGFNDGNKRISLVATLLFLEINGYEVLADDDLLYEVWSDLGAGEMTEQEMADFLAEVMVSIAEEPEFVIKRKVILRLKFRLVRRSGGKVGKGLVLTMRESDDGLD